MRYVYTNPNPCKKIVGDCVVRAVAIAEQREWQDIYIGLCMQGLEMCDMPSSNCVWKAYLRKRGYERYQIPESITVSQFASLHKYGTFVLCTGNHVVAVRSGNYYDSWDSGSEEIIFCMTKER